MKHKAPNEAIVKVIALIIIVLVLLAVAIFVPISSAHALPSQGYTHDVGLVQTHMTVDNPGYDTTRSIRIAAVLGWLFSLAILVLMLHVIIRRLRNIEEVHRRELHRIRAGIAVISEWMAHHDIGLGRLFEKTGLMEEGASLDDTLKIFAEEVEAKSWMTMPRESFKETMERLSKEGSGFDDIDLSKEGPGFDFDEIDEVIELTEEIAEPLPFTVPNLEFGGDWRETDEYVNMRNGQEGC